MSKPFHTFSGLLAVAMLVSAWVPWGPKVVLAKDPFGQGFSGNAYQSAKRLASQLQSAAGQQPGSLGKDFPHGSKGGPKPPNDPTPNPPANPGPQKPPTDPTPPAGPGKPDHGHGGHGHGGHGHGGHGHGGHGNGNHHKFPWPVVVPVYRPSYPSYPVQKVIYNQVPAQVTQPATKVNADLVLEDLELAQPATLVVGPAYRVKFRNQSLTAVGGFRVGVLAGVDGKLSDDAPQAIVEVASLAAGEVGEVTVRLPKSALQMVSSTGAATTFSHLFVAVDLDNAISEMDKANNAAVVERAQLETGAK